MKFEFCFFFFLQKFRFLKIVSKKERVRLTHELQVMAADMFPVRDLAQWINAYVEEHLVGHDAILRQSITAIERGDKILATRLAAHDELIQQMQRLIDKENQLPPEQRAASVDVAKQNDEKEQKESSKEQKNPDVLKEYEKEIDETIQAKPITTPIEVI